MKLLSERESSESVSADSSSERESDEADNVNIPVKQQRVVAAPRLNWPRMQSLVNTFHEFHRRGSRAQLSTIIERCVRNPGPERPSECVWTCKRFGKYLVVVVPLLCRIDLGAG